jgi:hypothetical protein
MRKIHLILAAMIVAKLAIFDMALPASAARTWKDWANSGYCPPKTCNLLGGRKAVDVRNCGAANCRIHPHFNYSTRSSNP